MTATEAEVAALNRDLSARLAARDARPPVQSELPADHPARRKPLGLTPGAGSSEPIPSDEPGPAFVSGAPSVLEGLSEATRQRAATLSDVAVCLDAAIAMDSDGDKLFHEKISELRGENARLETEIARLRAQFAEAKAEFAEAKHILERLQITREGKRGERGPCGADGAPGPRGEKGDRGERGASAPAVIEWRPDSETFSLQAILSDGSTGPMIALRPLFESYHNAVSWVEDADLVEAARLSRLENERQSRAFAEGQPVRRSL
jgi:hypothetical protein